MGEVSSSTLNNWVLYVMKQDIKYNPILKVGKDF